MNKTSKISQTAIDKSTHLVYNKDMTNDNDNKGNDMNVIESGFKVLREFRGNGVYRRYLVEHQIMGNYAVHISQKELTIGERMNVIVPEETSRSKNYLKKLYK